MAWEKYENAYDQTWTTVATPTVSFVNTGSHVGSSYHLQLTGASGDYMWCEPAGSGNLIYWAGWFKVTTDNMADGSSILVFDIRTASTGLLVFTMTLAKAGVQLTITPGYYNAKAGSAINITAGTWYHWGIKYNNADEKWDLYWSTVADLGAAVQSGTADASTRAPGRLRVGFISASGTYGSDATIVGYDSFDVDYSALVHNAEDAASVEDSCIGFVPIILNSCLIGRYL